MTGWALSLRRSEVESLAKLHPAGDVSIGETAEDSELVWARGLAPAQGLDAVLALVPTSCFFEIVHEDRLRPIGRILPVARLPSLRWTPLRQWLRVRAPGAALPGNLSRVVRLELTRVSPRRVRAGCEEMVVCGVRVFREFLLHAPTHRLSRLFFVLNDASGEVLVRGQPPPSVPTERYVLEDGIATPVGYGWSPAVGAGVVRSWLGVRERVLVLWRDDSHLSEIAEDDFVAASRRAGREL